MEESFTNWESFDNETDSGAIVVNSENKDYEIELFDNSISYQENFQDGKDVKYLLVPIYSHEKYKSNNFTNLFNAGGKIIIPKSTNKGKIKITNYLIVDFEPIFGLRWKMFKRYKTDFSSDERLVYELLLIKFKHFEYKEFFMSYNDILKELGIRETRARTIIKNFEKNRIITKRVKLEKFNNNPSKRTYYTLNPREILKFQDKIIHSDFIEEVTTELKLYLEPVLKKRES